MYTGSHFFRKNGTSSNIFLAVGIRPLEPRKRNITFWRQIFSIKWL